MYFTLKFWSNILIVLIMVLFIGGCIETTTSKGQLYGQDALTIEPFSGVNQSSEEDKTKRNKQLPSRELSRRESKLKEAEQIYIANPLNENAIIWYGRRLAYLGKYEEAIAIYSEGLKTFPESYQLFRHRGHRYITLRAFDRAIEDLQKAAFYARNEPIIIEPDGIPNSMNKPLSNNKFNIWYHLGLAYYLKGNYDKAISAYKKCMEVSNNNDLKVATNCWLYATYRKLGNYDAAQALVETIPSRMNLVENRTYHDLIMLYRGFVTSEVLIARNTSSELDAVIGYGIANFYQMEGRVSDAQQMLTRILNGSQWDSFGYIAAEVEVERLSDRIGL